MKNNLLAFLFLLSGLNFTYSQNCPVFSNNVSSSSQACSGQVYFFEVENSACPGTISFNFSGSYGFPGGATWQITSTLTGDIIASGTGNNFFGGTFNTNVGPIDVSVQGAVFRVQTNASVTAYEITQGTNVLSSGGGGTNNTFLPRITISEATLTITTPSGPIVSTVGNCRSFKTQVTLSNSNFCTSTSVDLPWQITCAVSGSLIASGTHTLTVNPNLPTDMSDVISISWNANDCEWDVVGQNDCNLTHLGSIFTISPDVVNSPVDSCLGSLQTFVMQYNGLPGGADCCSTGGPLETITQEVDFEQLDATVVSSPYGGTNNAAYFVIPSNGSGGEATSVTINASMTGFCFNPPSTSTDFTFYAILYVDGVVILFQSYNGTSFNETFNLSDITDGFDENSVVELYILPNTFSAGGVNTTYNPSANCGSLQDGHWNAATMNLTLSVEYTEQAPTPTDCLFEIDVQTTSCSSSTVVPVFESPGDFCFGENIPDLPTTSLNGISGTWSPAINNTASTTYTFTPNAGQCADEQMLTIEIFEVPEFEIEYSQLENCGDVTSVLLTGLQNNQSYTITYSANGSAVGPVSLVSNSFGVVSINNLGLGEYQGFSVSLGPCSYTVDSLFELIEPETPQAPTAGDNQTVCFGEELEDLNAIPSVSGTIQWYDNLDLVNLIFTGETFQPSRSLGVNVYYVTETLNNCESEPSMVAVTIQNCDKVLLLPNAFTPNGDGINDLFEVVNASDFREIEMRIYNRWGQLVHEGVNDNHGWNGTFNSEMQNADIYIYYINVLPVSSNEYSVYKAHFTLIR
jgi:gliding motility-associated-like protein